MTSPVAPKRGLPSISFSDEILQEESKIHKAGDETKVPDKGRDQPNITTPCPGRHHKIGQNVVEEAYLDGVAEGLRQGALERSKMEKALAEREQQLAEAMADIARVTADRVPKSKEAAEAKAQAKHLERDLAAQKNRVEELLAAQTPASS